MALVTKEEYGNLSVTWATANFPPFPISKLVNVKEPEFDLDKIKGKVKLTKLITIAPFETVQVPGLTECTQHFRRVHVMTEVSDKFRHDVIRPICVYSDLKPGSSRVMVGLRNLSCKSVTIKSKTVVVKVSAANLIPISMAPNLEGEGKEELKEQYEEQIDFELFRI